MSDCVVLCCVAVTLCGTRRLQSILPHEYAAAIAAHRARVDNIRSLAASVATVEDGGMPAEMATQLQAVRQLDCLSAKHNVSSGVCCYISVTCYARLQAIHAHFKEWLETGNLAQINDLLHFDLDAVMTGKTGATSPFSAPPVTPTKPLQ